MSKSRRVKIEAAVVFVIVFIYGRYSSPEPIPWADLLALGSARFDIAFARLAGAALLPGVVAVVWYIIRKPKPSRPGTP